jgi:DNA-binding response OmpR family regulator/predicted regulator of Ras-like GTPase activity (Roadblock/LC7/MglB family)
MSEQWRILIVEDEENLNWSIVNSLRKDGYLVQGVMNGAEAIRTLQTGGYDVVISDLKMPGADGFELLQWLRMYRPGTRLIMVTAFGSASTRNQALEGGVVSYLEKPFDLHTLKEELRRLLQQTGFSANLDSFDLLDVIQIITMSRKSIALLVNTGLEERGILRFQAGELIWAEYGILRGEEAFFALAAHKNGVVIHQPDQGLYTPNVTQPLSRLIFQALQYRTKYATAQQHSSEHIAVQTGGQDLQGEARTPLWDLRLSLQQDVAQTNVADPHAGTIEEDDRPFVYVAEEEEDRTGPLERQATGRTGEDLKGAAQDHWQSPGLPAWRLRALHHSVAGQDQGADLETSHPLELDGREWWQKNSPANSDPGPRQAPDQTHPSRSDLPSWLTEQATKDSIPALRPSSLSGSGEMPAQGAGKPSFLTNFASLGQNDFDQFREPGQDVFAARATAAPGTNQPDEQARTAPAQTRPYPTANTPPTEDRANLTRQDQGSGLATEQSDILQGETRGQPGNLHLPLQQAPLHHSRWDQMVRPPALSRKTLELPAAPSGREPFPEETGRARPKRTLKRSYSTLVSALQTLGYSIPGFVATAVITLDGHPIAQVAIDDIDISPLYGYLSTMLQGALLALEHVDWGSFQDSVINCSTEQASLTGQEQGDPIHPRIGRRILLRLIGDESEAFHILVTTHEADPVESLKLMANLAGAIAAALR